VSHLGWTQLAKSDSCFRKLKGATASKKAQLRRDSKLRRIHPRHYLP